ncbi:ribosomal protein S12 methylthiotransferase accessory factor [Bradyrhizobium lablabi]|uniref:Ribosomal protein S12 methylthiotransferase accessory factor n=1 Tax=Bradyrhizobium lablabi TaxID=722472 RepID=A0A1M6UKB3_9BRAD|nr:ribosomal protein S12 methylthiotransferase accessory factor [Bradyrhizobium lablabi]
MNLTPLDLYSPSGGKLLDSIASLASAELVALAGRLTRVFSIASPFAPGLHCIGGEVTIDADPTAASGAVRLSVAGNGETLASALVSCLGEAAEFLSQFERPGDIEAAASDRTNFVADGWIAEAVSHADRTIDWTAGSDASTGDIALLPADLCLRRSPTRRAIEPVGALSSGAAAGPSFETAALRAVLELCERDAAALWWLGGFRPKRFALEHPATKAGAELIERLRQGETARRTVLLDITTDNGVPVVAAVSMDHDGRGMACGLSSRLTASDAARAAVLEMCQMEMAAPIAQTKRAEGGDAVLNEADRRHLRRAEFAAADCELLHPRDMSRHAANGPAAALGLKGLVGHLRNCGVRLFLVDHTRHDIGVAAARAVSPDLQPFSAAVSTKRFAKARDKGSDIAEHETPLL